MKPWIITVNVNIQALTDLVALLRANSQAEIDKLTAEVSGLASKLSTSNQGLQAEINKE